MPMRLVPDRAEVIPGDAGSVGNRQLTELAAELGGRLHVHLIRPTGYDL